MNEVLANVFQLKVPIPNNPLGHTNVYLLRTDDGYMMIDAGFNSQQALEAMQQQLAELDVDFKKISRIIITHAHGDHIGLAGKLRELSGAKVVLHRLEKPQMRPSARDRESFVQQTEDWMHANGIPHQEPPPGRSLHEMVRRFEPPPAPDITLDDEETIRSDGFSLKVIWTPGHSPGHICLYDASRKVLFSADHVLPVTTPNIGLRPGAGGNPLGDYLASLRKVRDLDVDTVLPAHEQVFKDLPGRVDQILEHHRHRNEEIIAVLKEGPRTAYQVSERITWMPDSGGVKFHDLGHWDQRMAVSETLSHLEVLKEQGVVDRYRQDGIIYYRIRR